MADEGSELEKTPSGFGVAAITFNEKDAQVTADECFRLF